LFRKEEKKEGQKIRLEIAERREHSASQANQRRNSFSPFTGDEAEMGIFLNIKKREEMKSNISSPLNNGQQLQEPQDLVMFPVTL
jgi:hypothetical protein